MKKYLIFDLDWTLVQSANQIDTIIYKYIQDNLDPDLIEYARYLIQNKQWMSIYEWVEILLECDKQTAKYHGDKIYNEINKVTKEIDFFEWVPEKIKQLSKSYTLFLSTGNSDEFAEKMLKKWEIYDCFEKIMWSSFIPKSPEHIEQFKKQSENKNFIDEAIFIWDGQVDEAIAKFHGMDFIHISPFTQNKFQIKSVNQIDDILNIFF